MKKVVLILLMVGVLLSPGGCAEPSANGEDAASGETLRSEKERITAPEVDESDLATLVEGNNSFALDLYRALRETDRNLFYSPYSISLALGMVHAGARGETEQQMADTLRFGLPPRRLHPAFNSLDIELATRGEGAEGKDGEGFRLNIVNAIWGQEGYGFLAAFLDLLAENYGAGLRVLDFASAPEASRVTINNWVSEHTEGRIEDLIPPGLISEITRTVITNAIYFNAAWQHQFNERATSDGTFYLLDGGEVTARMMNRTAPFGYAEGDSYQAVELPYDGGELSMLVLLPRPGEFEAFESSLDAQRVKDIAESLEARRVVLTMPRFGFQSSYRLAEVLGAMGMPIAFSADADFSGMTGKRELFISEVLHKAFVSVDEAGTEAAASTAVIMPGGIEDDTSSVVVTLERPFVFVIRDIKTGTILFVGRLVSPGE